MQIPPNITKCVAFLGTKRPDGIQYIGTTFLVGYALEINGAVECYAVTARHVIELMSGFDPAKGKPDERLASIDNCSYFRFNTKHHGLKEVGLPLSRWVFHRDPRVDVALAQMPYDVGLDHLWIPEAMLLPADKAQSEGVGAGDELFFPGLFTRHVGTSANVPIIRTGNIAAMPMEPVNTPLGMARSYLAEARSIAGLSGSPVFVVQEMKKVVPDRDEIIRLPYPLYSLLGMVQGHFGAGSLLDSDDDTMADASGHKSVNIGISFVTPADSILELLNDPELVNQRAEHFKEILAKRGDNRAELD